MKPGLPARGRDRAAGPVGLRGAGERGRPGGSAALRVLGAQRSARGSVSIDPASGRRLSEHNEIYRYAFPKDPPPSSPQAEVCLAALSAGCAIPRGRHGEGRRGLHRGVVGMGRNAQGCGHGPECRSSRSVWTPLSDTGFGSWVTLCEARG